MKKLLFAFIFSQICLAQNTLTPNTGMQVPPTGSANWNVPLNYNFNRLDSILGGTLNLTTLAWNPKTIYGSGSPAGSCTTLNERQTYLDTSVTPYKTYICHSLSWQFTGPTGTLLNGVTQDSFNNVSFPAKITLGADPVNALDVSTKQWTDTTRFRSALSKVMAKMQRGVEDAYWINFGDSMSFDYPTPILRWMNIAAHQVGANFPKYTVKYQLWDATTCTSAATFGGTITGYTNGDVVTVVQAGASGCQYTLTVAGGNVTGLTLLAGGEVYSPAQNLATTGGTGTGLTISLLTTGSWGSSTAGGWQTFQTGNNQTVVNAYITSAGTGQTTGTYTINSSGGGGTGAQISVSISGGTCNTIQVISNGSGYTSVPTFTVSEGGTPCVIQALVIPTLWISNASYPGMTTQFDLGPSLPVMLAGAFPTPISTVPNPLSSYVPDLVTVAQGYNMGGSVSSWSTDMLALTETLEHFTNGASLILFAEPWSCSPAGQQAYNIQRSSSYEAVAASRGYGFVNVGQAFYNASPTNWCSLYINSDGIHPNNAGSAIWAALFSYGWSFDPLTPPSAGQKSSLDSPNDDQIVINGTFQSVSGGTPTGWTLSSGTASLDTTNYISPNGYSINVAGTSTTAALSQSLPIAKVKGQWISAWAMEYVPTGQYSVAQTMYAGYVALVDSTGSNTSTQTTTDLANGFGNFHLVGVCRYIPSTAVSASVTIYGSVGSVASNASFDSVSVTKGCNPTINPYLTVSFNLSNNSYTWGSNGGSSMYHKLNAAANTQKGIVAQTAGVGRWFFGSNGNTESGSNTGSDWILQAQDDSGATIDIPIDCVRAAGGVCLLSRQQRVTQNSNGTDTIVERRFTDTSPTGSFLRLQGAGGSADLYKVDAGTTITAAQAGSSIASASTIAPVSPFVHVTGTTAINTITVPSPCTTTSTMCQITLIPDGLWTTTTSGNIAIASVAVVSKALIMTYDPATSKWYPDY